MGVSEAVSGEGHLRVSRGCPGVSEAGDFSPGILLRALEPLQTPRMRQEESVENRIRAAIRDGGHASDRLKVSRED